MKAGRGAGVWNDVKGGFSINYTFNLGAIGASNTMFKVYGGNCVATPRGNSSAGVGNIAFVGLDYKQTVYKQIDLHISPADQTRTGQGIYDRNYPGIQAFISRGDGGASLYAANDRYQSFAMEQLRPSWDE